MLIEHMEQGKSFETFGAVLYRYTKGSENEVRASKSVLYDWIDKHTDFKEAKDFGWVLSYEFWEEMGITAVNSPPGQFNTGVWFANMKNRFGWRDRMDKGDLGEDSEREKPGFNISPND